MVRQSPVDPGFDWYKEIKSACETSRIILPVLTPQWKRSQWTRYETYGHDQVIPLVFEGEFVDVSTPPLRHFQAFSIDLHPLEDQTWHRLMAAIRSALATPVPEHSQHHTRMSMIGHTKYFVGREDKLNEIHEMLWTSPTATLTQGGVRALAALGGVGKTTLARAYAEQFWRLYPHAFWIDCRKGIEREFAAIFDLLFENLANAGLEEAQKAII